MKNLIKIIVIINVLFITIYSCKSNKSEFIDKYCGYQLTDKEINTINKKALEQETIVYDADSIWSIYDQVNDSLRKTIPEDIVFEIFLNTLDESHFSITVISPPNQEYFETLSCKFMNAKFSGKIPDTRVLLMYSYTNPDGSGDSPFEFAIKNKNN